MRVFSTRPETIKLVPVITELWPHPDTRKNVVAVTAIVLQTKILYKFRNVLRMNCYDSK